MISAVTGRQVDAAGLLEVGELGDLHAVHDDLPADAPGAEGRRLPVVFLEPHVVLGEDDAQALEAPKVGPLDVLRRGLDDDLELQVLAETERVLPYRPSAGRREGWTYAHFQGSAVSTLRKVAGCIVPAPTGRS